MQPDASWVCLLGAAFLQVVGVTGLQHDVICVHKKRAMGETRRWPAVFYDGQQNVAASPIERRMLVLRKHLVLPRQESCCCMPTVKQGGVEVYVRIR